MHIFVQGIEKLEEKFSMFQTPYLIVNVKSVERMMRWTRWENAAALLCEVSWQNYSVCVQHFCLYSLRFYWGAKKGYLILHSYWKHLLKGEKKTYFLFLTKLYSTCNSPLHQHVAMVKLQKIFSEKSRRALRILICHCSKKLCK